MLGTALPCVLFNVQLLILDIFGMHRVVISTGASMDTDILSFFWRKALENRIEDFDEFGKEVFAGPFVSRVILQTQTT